MASSTRFLRHPSHKHPLESRELSHNEFFPPVCGLCHRKIWTKAYTCQEGCKSYYHRSCAEATPQIDRHPLHPIHPLSLIHGRPSFGCNACGEHFQSGGSSFTCDECDFHMDVSCALTTLSDRRGSPCPEQITLSLHSCPLTSFFERYDIVEVHDCKICGASVEGDGYMCLYRWCEFLIHKRCIPDLYYADGTKAPRVYHRHPLATIVREDVGSSTRAFWEPNKSGEFIGCATCKAFIHRDCIQVPEILRYPHHPNHTLILFLKPHDFPNLQCQSCSSNVAAELSYHCSLCKFFVHVGCALQVLAYCEEGMRVEIKLSWHEHPLLLCRRNEFVLEFCSYCEGLSTGPMYACKEKDCGFLLHKQCTEIKSAIHPHHPDHPFTLCSGGDKPVCEACFEDIIGLNFSCKFCGLYLHVKCVTRVPTRKHHLHEHELLCLDKVPSLDCGRCGDSIDAPFFRCIPCNFNLHEKCMELPPRVENSKVHWHPLTLQESYIEDESGEYYCDHCEQSRDIRLGAYVCGKCTARWAYHIDCVLPELRKMFVKEDDTAAIEKLAEEISRREEEIYVAERKLEEMNREVDELRKKHAALKKRSENRINC